MIQEMTKEEMRKEIEDLTQQVLNLQIQIESLQNGSGRKSQVLELLRGNKALSILSISEKLGISTKNVSSQLTYLRQDGYQIFTDPNGKKVLLEKTETE